MPVTVNGASLVAQTVKHLPAMRETWVRFLGREDPLEKEVLQIRQIAFFCDELSSIY